MQLVYGKSLDNVCQGYNEIICRISGYDGVNDDVDICRLIIVFRTFLKQFFEYVAVFCGQGLANL